MSRTLIAIRHAKSDWSRRVDDHARPLNGRGQRDAPRIGEWLADHGFVPDDAAVSSALRTRQTWAAISDRLPSTPSEYVEDELYNASANHILDVARAARVGIRAIVGHNPGIGIFMQQIVAERPSKHRFDDIPTGSTLVVRFQEQDWHQIDWRSGEVLGFVTPHEF
ncbi:MAG: histidine phosphatase family protein [Pseudomonadota bacterium]